MIPPCAAIAIATLTSVSMAIAQDSRAIVATIDGDPVTRAELNDYLLRLNFEHLALTLVLESMLDFELAKAGMTLSENDLRSEQRIVAERRVRQKLRPLSDQALRRETYLSLGWNLLLAASDVEPSDWSILKQVFIRRTMEGYEVRKRGGDPGPTPGLIAEVRPRDATASRRITEAAALAMIEDYVNAETLNEVLSDLVDARLVDRELAKSKKAVTAAEVNAWARSMQEKYKPPFDWDMMCRFKATTTDRERERWRRIQAWKRVGGREVEEEEMLAFVRKNPSHFLGQATPKPHRPPEELLNDPEMRPWIVEEFETLKMKEWLGSLRNRSRIELR
jgi:hypothetical protein